MKKHGRSFSSLKAFFPFVITLCMSTPGVQADAGALEQDFPHAYSADDTALIPHVYGKTIYSCNEKSPNQVYIIGMGHRDTVNRTNGDATVMSQMEVYRIAELLIKNQGVELLLPEGFFLKDADTTVRPATPLPTESIHPGTSVDSETLKNLLQDDIVYVNAEMLLMESRGLRAQQIEDNDLYQAVQNEIITLEKSRHDALSYFFKKSKLEHLQARRTAFMLQKIPGIVNEEFIEGSISTRKAIATIGLNHISGIIKYLEENRIAIYSPAFVTSLDDYIAEVNLLQEDYGVTIIIPRSLAESRRILRLTGLDHVI